jgi:DDE_Tnp_1-associated
VPPQRLDLQASIGLLQALSAVPDPRRSQGRCHSLQSILVLAVGAVLAGARSYAAIAQWAAEAGHNVKFDLAFLCGEYARAGWALPHLPAACTLDHSWDHLPDLLIDIAPAGGCGLTR